MSSEKLVLTAKDVAELFGTSEENIRLKVYRKQLPARRLGRRLIFLRDELEEYLKKLPPAVPEK